MENLPIEILIKIFSNCQPSDLLQLTETCTYFNRIISETKDLSKKFTIYFRKQTEPFQNLEGRKYCNLIVDNFIENLHSTSLDLIGDDLETLEIRRWNWSLGVKILLILLKKCPNLKIIKFNKILFHYHLEIDESLQFKKLLELHVIESDSRIFKFFQNSQIRRLVYDYVPTGGSFPIPDMINFLRVQENLEELTLSGFLSFINAGIGRIIFQDSSLSNVNFRLKKFTIKISPILETFHFRQFLNLHAQTLKFLEIDGTEFWDFSIYINNCKFLEELIIGKRSASIPLDSLQSHTTVKKLRVEGPVDKRFLSNFPNLKILYVSKLKTEKDNFGEELACNQIEEMTVEKTWLGGFFKFPKLRKLKLKNIREMNFNIFRVNSEIEELVIEHCEYVLACEEEYRMLLRNLKHFKKIYRFSIEPQD